MRTVLLSVVALVASQTAAGQARETADQGIRIQSYALGSYTRPMVFTTDKGATAFTVGSSLNLFHFGRMQPGVDVRASTTFGPTREIFVGGGPRVQFDFGRLHPYANYLFGYGKLSFTSGNPAYTHDNAFVTSVGGGVDFRLNREWALRFDVQRQSWGMGGAERFSPTTTSIGLRYQFHFRNHHGPE